MKCSEPFADLVCLLSMFPNLIELSCWSWLYAGHDSPQNSTVRQPLVEEYLSKLQRLTLKFYQYALCPVPWLEPNMENDIKDSRFSSSMPNNDEDVSDSQIIATKASSSLL